MSKERLILIAGPTASGKSALALAVAERLGGTVINADSMQVYRELRVLTARPTPEDEARVPHALYGFVPGADAYSAARFAVDAARAIVEARDAGRLPIVVGGTGLYFKALIEGLSPVPPVPPEIREHWRDEAERLDAPRLHAALSERDPVMAGRLAPTDPQRIVRALEVWEATGRSLAAWQEQSGEPVVAAEKALKLIATVDRDEIHRRCDERFDRMMADGALDEASALASLGLDTGLPVMRALGVRPLLDHIAGKLSREEAVAHAKAETRRYVKRQATWIRSNMRSWNVINTQEIERNIGKIIDFIKS